MKLGSREKGNMSIAKPAGKAEVYLKESKHLRKF